MRRHPTRRAFLRGMTATAAATPLMGLMSRPVWADEKPPKRLLVVFKPNGTRKELWSPTGGETDFVLGPLLRPLERHRNALVILDGVDLVSANVGPGGPHQRAMATLLSNTEIQPGSFIGGDGRAAGWGGGITVDQFLARRLEPPTRFSTLELGVLVADNNPRSRLSYRGPGQPVPPQNDPVAVFQRVFGDMLRDPGELDRKAARRRSVLDTVLADFRALRPRLGHFDQRKLDQHFDSMREMERRLGLLNGASNLCNGMVEPSSMRPLSEDEFERLARAQIDVAVNALACDQTRIATLQMSSAVNHVRFTFMGLREHQGHTLSHASDNNETMQQQWIATNTWYAEQFAYLLDQLASVPEGDGTTLLDNTLVLWCSELSRGNTHSFSDMPFVLAGGSGGALRTGRYLTYDSAPHGELLSAIVNLMGVELEVFGDERFCAGPLSGLA